MWIDLSFIHPEHIGCRLQTVHLNTTWSLTVERKPLSLWSEKTFYLKWKQRHCNSDGILDLERNAFEVLSGRWKASNKRRTDKRICMLILYSSPYCFPLLEQSGWNRRPYACPDIINWENIENNTLLTQTGDNLLMCFKCLFNIWQVCGCWKMFYNIIKSQNQTQLCNKEYFNSWTDVW